jgi:hypothetical protein
MKSATLPDGFFLGQVPPNWTEYVRTLSWEDAHNNRVKVRIPGKHSKGPEILDKDLPWAIVSQSTSTGNRNGASTGLSGGEWVIGFYLDEDEQLPVIMQVLGRNEVSGAKIKASENGTTQFRDVSRFASFTAPSTMLKGGPPPDASAEPSKEEIKKGTQSPPPPAETGEELPGFVPEAEAAAEAAEAQAAAEARAIENIPEPTGDVIDLSDATVDTRTQAQIQADIDARIQQQTIERAFSRMNADGIQGQAGGVAVNRTPTPDELQQFESKGYRFVPGSNGRGTIVKDVGQNYG